MEVIIPWLMARIIDQGINMGNMDVIVRTGLILVAAALLSLFFGIMSGRSAADASAGFAKNLRKDMYHNIQEFSFANIDTFSSASLITRLTSDVSHLQNAFQMIVRIAARAPIMLISSLIMAFTINPRLSLVFLAVIPVLGIGLLLIANRAHPIFERVFRIMDRLNAIVQENLRGIRVVKSYVREEHETEKFRGASQDIYDGFSGAERILALNNPLMQLSMYSCTLLISWFGAQMIVSDTMTTGQLMSLISYSSQILSSLMMLSMIFVMLTISRAAAERVVEVLNERSDLQNGGQPHQQVADGSISFEQVSFSYGGQEGTLSLKDVNLQIKAGETIGIIGGTGSSKSTLVQLIPRLYDVSSGSLKVGGIDVREYDLTVLRQDVAVVLQKNELFAGSIKDNLRWGNPEASDEALIHACRLAQADSFIEALPEGYDTHVEQGGTNFSGGQKQRLCIARALLKKPKILILDDSTSAVDTRTDALIRRALREEIPATTKLIIAQRISSVEHADRIIVMDGGRIDAIGSHEELLQSSSIYQEVYYSQMKGADFDVA